MENLVTQVTGSAERHPGGTLPLAGSGCLIPNTSIDERTPSSLVVVELQKMGEKIKKSNSQQGPSYFFITF